MKLKVAVVGAGVIGLSAALHITERFPDLLDVTVIADKFTPDTVSDKSCAIFKPSDYYVGSATSSDKDASIYQEDVKRWFRDTWAKIQDIYKSESNSEVQVTMTTGYHIHCKETPDPWWKSCVYGFRHVDLDSDETQLINLPAESKRLWCYSTYTLDPSLYLQWLQKEFMSNRGKIEKRKVESLEELSTEYDIVINCTGVWAGRLVAEENMQPTRGQSVLVKAPWVNHFVIDHRGGTHPTYIYARANAVVLGGSLEPGNWDEAAIEKTTEDILERCAKLEPSLAKAKVINVTAGLRPVRSQIRLDTSVSPNGGLVIHCYGHGGQGVMFSWGCAKDIGDIVQEQVYLRERKAV